MHLEVIETTAILKLHSIGIASRGWCRCKEKSSARVHGILTVPGSDHEPMVPTEVGIPAEHCDATLPFAGPYAKRGMKNPGTFALRVSESVDIDVITVGTTGRR
jgi:hypothetical protein